MRKFKKILATISSVTLMSCFGNIKSEAVRYNEKGVPIDLELSKNFDDEELCKVLQCVNKFISDTDSDVTFDEAIANTSVLESRYLYKEILHKSDYEKLSKEKILSDEELDEFVSKYQWSTPVLFSNYFDYFTKNGNKYCCRVTAGYVWTLLNKYNIECYNFCVATDKHHPRTIIVFKTKSNGWFVCPCGLNLESDFQIISLSDYISGYLEKISKDSSFLMINLAHHNIRCESPERFYCEDDINYLLENCDNCFNEMVEEFKKYNVK